MIASPTVALLGGMLLLTLWLAPTGAAATKSSPTKSPSTKAPPPKSSAPKTVVPPPGKPAPVSPKPSSKVVLRTDLGTYHFPITTKSRLAQAYFDQGIRLSYAFNHAEAIRSYEEVLRQDPAAGMAYWGIAHALGPNINAPMDRAAERRAVAAMNKARQLAPKLSASERDYVAALSYRYSDVSRSNRKAEDQKYADAMRVLAKKYPADLDAATLAAEALMNLNPWDYWTPDGQPKRGTQEVLTILERVLKQNPNHPGACHYYVHAVEASTQPERAIPCADRLPKLMPGAGHLVHMPAHIYMRVGRYAEAVERNLHGAHVDEALLREGRRGFYTMYYYPHNLHFLWAALLMEGRSREAKQAATDLEKAFSPEMVKEVPELELYSPTKLFGLVRFGQWEAILKEPPPSWHLAYTTGIFHYARGLAFARRGELGHADEERRLLGIAVEAMHSSRIVGYNSAKSLLQIAEQVLVGELAALRGQEELAVRALAEAVELEDPLVYDEPPAWYYAVRQSLGAVLLKFGRAQEAERAYREDLARHPNNGWSLFGLAQALASQGRKEEASAVEQRFRTAWARADVVLTASRF